MPNLEVPRSEFNKLISQLELYQADIDGDTSTFSSPKAMTSSEGRFRTLREILPRLVRNFRKNLKSADKNSEFCLSQYATEDALATILDVAEWIQERIIGWINETKPLLIPNLGGGAIGAAIGGISQLRQLAEKAKELPLIKDQYQDDVVNRFREALDDLKNAPIDCEKEDEEDKGDADCATIAAALNKLAAALAEKNQEEGSLKDIEEKLEKICVAVGCEDFPAKVPACITDKSKGFTQVENIPQYLKWQILQMDATLGAYPIEVEVEDDDISTAGKQKKKIKLPNLAEAIAEIYGLNSITRNLADAILNCTTRSMIEIGSTRKSTLQTQYEVMALNEYMGFGCNEVPHKIPFSFDPTQQKLSDALRCSKQEITLTEYAPRKEEKGGWSAISRELITGVGILRANFLEPLDSSSPFGPQIAHNFRKAKAAGVGTDDFQDFLNRVVERGATDASGIKDPQNPYGRSVSSRPRIREIGATAAVKGD